MATSKDVTEERLNPVEKFAKSLTKDESLFESGFLNSLLMRYTSKIIKKAENGSFDFDKLHRTEK